jgi:hypothetical protein
VTLSSSPDPLVKVVEGLEVGSLVVTKYASLPGSSASGAAVGGLYTCTGAENPLGFPIVFASLTPPVVPPASYVALVSYYSSTGFLVAQSNPAAWSPTQITVEASQQPAAGDSVSIALIPT